jgi:hypothetical protein
MGGNPFDDLGASVESLRNEVRTLASQVHLLCNGGNLAPLLSRLDVIVAAVATPPAEWEALADAAAARRKGRGQLLIAINNGTIAAKRVKGRGGHGKWLLRVADLDKHFPVHGERQEKKKPKTQLLGFSEAQASDVGRHSMTPTPAVVEDLFG